MEQGHRQAVASLHRLAFFSLVICFVTFPHAKRIEYLSGICQPQVTWYIREALALEWALQLETPLRSKVLHPFPLPLPTLVGFPYSSLF